MKRVARLGSLLLAILFVPPAAAAEFDLAALMAMLAGVTASKDSFTESKGSALLSAPLVLKGTLAYARPDRLEKHVLSPYEEKTVIAGNFVTIENRTLKQKRSFSLSSSTTVAALIESMRATLAGDGATLERHYRTQVDGTRDAWLLLLLPREEQLAGAVTRIQIAGARERVKRIEVEEHSGDRSIMLIGPESP